MPAPCFRMWLITYTRISLLYYSIICVSTAPHSTLIDFS